MSVKLDNVVPWGRSLDEYRKMFNLPENLTELKLISLADGPASFNAELTKLGGSVTSLDPIYQFNNEEIKSAFNKSASLVIDQVKATPNNWVWNYHKNADDLLKARRTALHHFLHDYNKGLQTNRYVYGSLPSTNFKSGDYNIALCSHFLFLYSDHFDYEFHLSAVKEMCRLADDVRIFPLLTLKQEYSPHIRGIVEKLKEEGYSCVIQEVEYELQKGGNKMLKITK